MLDAVQSAVRQHSTYAEVFEPYPSRRDREHPYYRIYLNNYTIFYVVIGDIMEVSRIIYSKRNLSDQI